MATPESRQINPAVHMGSFKVWRRKRTCGAFRSANNTRIKATSR